MRRSGALRRRAPLRSQPGRRAIPDDVKEAVRRRSRGRCEIDHVDCPGSAAHFHHRLMRSAGGPHTEENLIHLCVQKHHEIHADPASAYRRGWLVRRGADPLTTPWTSRDNQTLR